MFADSYRALFLMYPKWLPYTPSHFTFIYRINDKSLAVVSQHNQPFYLLTPLRMLTRGTRLALDWTYIGGTVTVHLIGIIPMILFTQYITSTFIQVLETWNTIYSIY